METKAKRSDEITPQERAHQKLAREAAAESIVLLENDGVLPLVPGKLALYGAGAEYTIRGGTGSGEVNVRHSVSVLEGLEAAGFSVCTKDWIDRYDARWQAGKAAFVAAQRKKLWHFNVHVLADLMAAEYAYPSGDPLTSSELEKAETDLCVYVLSRQSGEGKDRRDEPGSFRLTDTEIQNIRLCAGAFARFVLVLNCGAPMDLSPLEEIQGINAVVYMNQLGMEGGNALADVLTGRVTPGGRLAVSWPRCYEDVPFGREFGLQDRNTVEYKEGIFVGYRYYDSFGVQPRYPFGYGLSYTSFQTDDIQAELRDTEIQVSLRITNTGKHSGRQALQLYASCPEEGLNKEYQRLAAFGKTKCLKPGEAEELTLVFPLSALAVYDEKAAQTILEPGDYLLRLGSSSRDTKMVACLRLARRVVLSQHRNLCAAPKQVQTLTAPKREPEDLSDIPVLEIDPFVFEPVTYDYTEQKQRFFAEVEAHLSRFTTKDMVRFCAGTGLFGENRGFQVPGAVGHTTTAYLKDGIPNRELCDGPAGLRLQRRSTMDKKGKIKAVDASISLYEYLPRWLRVLLLGDPEKDPVLYQYVTGFPVSAALAQSWDPALLRRVGEAVGEEMWEYGVSWWLAPAMNLVRNPLCGRNYEYYSEDPLLTGLLAAAVTEGVQQTPGCFVTVKHFAANNQEENRYFVSSQVDERALRELYLRSFELAVRQSGPKALMTAYNKINGVYCANNRELCTDLLRGEWGFDGVVMTDWLSTGKGRAAEGLCPVSGVDLIMPGGKGVVKALLRAVKDGTLSPDALRQSCGRVLSCALEI